MNSVCAEILLEATKQEREKLVNPVNAEILLGSRQKAKLTEKFLNSVNAEIRNESALVRLVLKQVNPAHTLN